MSLKLVVTSALPRSGKTTVAGYLQELGFARIAGDPLREMLFGRSAPELVGDEDFELKEYGILWPIINYMKLGLLSRGCNVVIDASAVYNDMRRQLLHTLSINAEKYLIVLRTDPFELERREIRRSGSLDYHRKLATGWEEPASDLGCMILEYRSDTPEDLEAIKADIRTKFRGQ